MPDHTHRDPEILVFPDRVLDGTWRVEVMDADADGAVATAVFGGCGDAEARARAYAEWVRSGQSEAARLLLALLRDSQAARNRYLPAGGYDAERALDALLELLGGPRWRESERRALRE